MAASVTTSHSEGPGALSRGERTEPWLESPSADSRESAMPQGNNRSFNGPCQVRSGLAHASRPRVDQKGKAQAQGEEQAQNRTESKSGKSKPRPAVHQDQTQQRKSQGQKSKRRCNGKDRQDRTTRRKSLQGETSWPQLQKDACVLSANRSNIRFRVVHHTTNNP